MNSRPTWSTELVPGLPGLHKETLSTNKKVHFVSACHQNVKSLNGVLWHQPLRNFSRSPGTNWSYKSFEPLCGSWALGTKPRSSERSLATWPSLQSNSGEASVGGCPSSKSAWATVERWTSWERDRAIGLSDGEGGRGKTVPAV